MSRLSVKDEERAREVIDGLGQCGARAPATIDRALPMIRELLGSEFTCGYRFARAEADLAEVDFLKLSGFPIDNDHVCDVVRPFLQRMERRRGLHDPIRPEMAQRNRVLPLPWSRWCAGEGPEDVARELEPGLPKYGLHSERARDAAQTIWELEMCFRTVGMPARDQLRVLVCEGNTLLAWVGAFQAERFSERQRLLLKRVAAPLRERLIVERRAGYGLGHAAMVAALEHVPAAAYVLDRKGRVAYANAVGRARLSVDAGAVRAQLSRAVAAEPGGRGEFAVTELVGDGLPTHYLAIGGTHGDRVRHGIERARVVWGLTAREVEILVELAAGRSNRDIADRLAIAPRTVEVHLSSLLRKAYADSRSQLVIDLWQLAERP